MSEASPAATPELSPAVRPVLGWLGFAFGALAFLVAVTVFWAGPFAPQQSAGTGLGELAADFGKSVVRNAAGLPSPEGKPLARDIDDLLEVAVAVLGGLAVILGIAGMIRHEKMRVGLAAAALGVGAIVFQLFTWTVMMIAGALIIGALFLSFASVFEDLFGG